MSTITWALLLAIAYSFTFINLGGSTTVPDSYRLGPGDHIAIQVLGEDDLSLEFRLGDSGTMDYPLLGKLQTAGLSTDELEQLISDGLRGPYLIDPDVTVTIREYRPFYIYGEILEPGAFPFDQSLTLSDALVMGGGLTDRAAGNRIYVIRASDSTRMAQTINSTDPVYAGDVITVPESVQGSAMPIGGEVL